jgi:hydrogenase maturation protease
MIVVVELVVVLVVVVGLSEHEFEHEHDGEFEFDNGYLRGICYHARCQGSLLARTRVGSCFGIGGVAGFPSAAGGRGGGNLPRRVGWEGTSHAPRVKNLHVTMTLCHDSPQHAGDRCDAHPARTPPQVRILGVGNILRGDDGVGVRVVEELLRVGLPSGVEAMDVGTAGLDPVFLLDGVRSIVVVDAMDRGGAPGDLYWFSAEQLREPSLQPASSAHSLGVGEVLSIARRLGAEVNIRVCGIQLGSVGYTMELTPEVAASVGRAVSLIRRELQELLH